MKTSIIIPIYNHKELTLQCLRSIEKHTDGDYEVVIIDNASSDGSVDDIENSGFEFDGKLIRNKENQGFAKACNQGASAADGELLMFLNNDTIVTDCWLSAMIRCLTEEDKCGVVGARLVHPGKGTIQHAGVEPFNGTWMTQHVHFGTYMDDPVVMKRQEHFAVTGACMLIPKSIFFEVGGFDEAFWCGWEDISLQNDIKAKGYRVLYEPSALVYHYESRTEGRYSAEDANQVHYFKKHYGHKG